MNKLSRLRAKSEEHDFGGLKLNIKSMTFPETSHFAELADNKKTAEALDYLLFVTLRKAMSTKEVDPVDGMTDDEIKEEVKLMDGKTALNIVKKVQEVSGLTDGTEEKKDLVNDNPQKTK